RKSRYGLQAMLICDDIGRILFFYSIFLGSSHDAKCFSTTEVTQSPHNFFDFGEFVLADFAYS
ncbi:hypothetical protein L211DRAFT_753371, partial [Terfezia boudieri ATCC MYA-4762]